MMALIVYLIMILIISSLLCTLLGIDSEGGIVAMFFITLIGVTVAIFMYISRFENEKKQLLKDKKLLEDTVSQIHKDISTLQLIIKETNNEMLLINLFKTLMPYNDYEKYFKDIETNQ